MKYETFDEVRAYAIQLHAGQQYDGKPYSVHLDRVVEIFDEVMWPLDTDGKPRQTIWSGAHPCPQHVSRRVALLHDALEDCDIGLPDLIANVGHAVALGVYFLSDEPGENRKARKAATYPKIRAALEADFYGATFVPIVKLCDRIANMEAGLGLSNKSLLGMYIKEDREFRYELVEHPDVLHVYAAGDAAWTRVVKLYNDTVELGRRLQEESKKMRGGS